MLQVWLPLNGNLNNQGLTNVTVTNGGTTVDNNGKIGKCYAFNGSSKITNTLPTPIDSSIGTLACWFKMTSLPSSSGFYNLMQLGNLGGYATCRFGVYMEYSTRINISIDGSDLNTNAYTHSLEANQWYHLCVTHDGTTVKLYIDGVEVLSKASTKGSYKTTASYLYVGGTSSWWLKGSMNDVRYYSTALSPKEIEILSRGLVAHYPLCDRYNSTNLIINGFGEFGAENWEYPSRVSTDVPSADSTIKSSVYENSTAEYISCVSSHSYTLSAYLKSTGATSGQTYPSLVPYDADKKFISTFNCLEGFNNTYRTTLRQALKKGDTVVYATDLSAWNTGNNYFNYCAIFGYKDSHGTVYPDMEYTQDSPVFATYADKSHIDKTNNTITLNAPFAGEDRPAGTVICQATAGSSYYYPFGGINLSTLSDWVFKTATFTPQNISRLRWAKYIRFFTYNNTKGAGMKLVDNTWNSSTVYDTSGYQYNGTITGELKSTSDSARYSYSTYFDGSSYISSNVSLSQIQTISAWCKTTKNKNTSQIVVACKESFLCLSFYNGTIISYFGNSSAGTGSKCTIGNSYIENGWNHIVVVATGTNTRKVYINGVELSATTNDYWSDSVNGLYIGTRNTSSSPYNFYGNISDVRLYATALSASQVAELYNTAVSVANNGTLMGYELVEV